MLASLIALILSSVLLCIVFFFFKQKTAYEMRISDWSSDVCSSDLHKPIPDTGERTHGHPLLHRHPRPRQGPCRRRVRIPLAGRRVHGTGAAGRTAHPRAVRTLARDAG